jgi:hypothetical protein
MADEWVAEQTHTRAELTVEGRDPLHGRRVVRDGLALDGGERSEETERGPEPRGDLRIGGSDRPSATKLTPGMTPPGTKPR